MPGTWIMRHELTTFLNPRSHSQSLPLESRNPFCGTTTVTHESPLLR
ncbi:MAG TPA: hypothetical protein VGQ67_13825 [Candidatus Polarisedimenticolia bacterium]|nr:hypothetical protein [Candidatus Polarisedimenticolia bacterium]